MRKPFVVRVDAPDPTVARAIAGALVEPLRVRGARVLLDGAKQGEGSLCAVHLLTGPRSLPGVQLRIGVWDESEGSRWLAPLDVPLEPTAAAERAVAFLEEWGFLPALKSGAPPPARAER